MSGESGRAFGELVQLLEHPLLQSNGSNSEGLPQGPNIYQLCDLVHRSSPLGASVSSCVKWVSSQPLAPGVVTRS